MLLLAASACGGGSSWVVADVATITEEERTARIVGVIEGYRDDANTDPVDASDIDGLVTFDERTVFLLISPRSADEPPHAYVLGAEDVFLGVAGLEDAVGTTWCHAPADRFDEGFAPAEFDPLDVLATWSKITDDVDDLGSEVFGEFETRRYRAVDGETTYDLWVDEDGRLRRLEWVKPGETATFEFQEFGREVTMPTLPKTPPAGADVRVEGLADFCFDNGPEIPQIEP